MSYLDPRVSPAALRTLSRRFLRDLTNSGGTLLLRLARPIPHNQCKTLVTKGRSVLFESQAVQQSGPDIYSDSGLDARR